jgi:hypothetical protein
LLQAVSSNKGWDWSAAVPSSLPDPGSKSHMVRIRPDGPLAIVFNDHTMHTLQVTHMMLAVRL